MNKPNKCKNCQWYGKPYWSIINPCDNCPMENVEIITRWQDPTIVELQQRIDKAIEILQDYDLVENKDKVISDTFKALRGEDNE